MRKRIKKVTYMPDWVLFWVGFIHCKVGVNVCDSWLKKKNEKLQMILQLEINECEKKVFELRRESRVALSLKLDNERKLSEYKKDKILVETNGSPEAIRKGRRLEEERREAEAFIEAVKKLIPEVTEKMDTIHAKRDYVIEMMKHNAASKFAAYKMGVRAAGNKEYEFEVQLDDFVGVYNEKHHEIDTKIATEAHKMLEN